MTAPVCEACSAVIPDAEYGVMLAAKGHWCLTHDPAKEQP